MISVLATLSLALVAGVSAKPISFLPPLAARNTTQIVADDGTITISEVAPGYSGYNLVWQEYFWGNPGEIINEANWNIITDLHVNNEWQTYTRSNQNMQISGGGTLQIVPRHDASTGAWTSGRVESTYTFTPQDGRRTLAEAKIRFGSAPQANSQGLWPAFWLLGDSIRHGTAWPACGEVDVMERVNGLFEGHGTVHCDHTNGGACNEPNGRSSTVGLANNDWHNWRVVWDRTPGSWTDETITWYLDGNQFHQVSGGLLNNEAAWNALAASPLFFILNVAVGGDWPGAPNGNTWDAFNVMMEVAYVAHYLSA